MKQVICGLTVKSAVGLVVALTMLFLPACVLVAPQIGHAQYVPPVGKPVMVAVPCPACKKWIKTPDGKMPSSCPYCGYSFVQQAKPKPTPQTKPKLQAINPFGDFLFYDVPIIPDDGKLKTRHLDPNGLAARAEEWSKELKQVDGRSRQKQEAQAQEFERDKQDLLKGQANGLALQQLKNVFADDEAWDSPPKGGGDTAPAWGGEGKIGLLREQTVREKELAELRRDKPRIDELNKKIAPSAEESAELAELQAKRNAVWGKAISNTDLTQEERDRLKLQMSVAPTTLDDHPMIDPRVFVQKEQYSDRYLDIARASVQAGVTTFAVAAVEEGGKQVVGALDSDPIRKGMGFDTGLATGKYVTENPNTTAGKGVVVFDYALTFIPAWKTVAVVDAVANAAGAGVRQAFVQYWAANDSSPYWDPQPIHTATEKWDYWYYEQNEWTQTFLKRVSAGRYDQ
jgi:DNA-directed RNA polymerase subunit RPC12/RpoP